MGRVNHKKDATNNPILLGFLGALFAIMGGIALFIGLTQEVTGEDGGDSSMMVVLIGALFFAVGVGFICFAFIRAKTIKEYNALLEDLGAYNTKANFIKKRIYSSSSTSVGVGRIDIPTSVHVFYKVYYSYRDEVGVNHEVKSTMTYTREQAEYLESLGTFAIKCKGKQSVIIEEMPQTRDLFNI